MHPKAHCGRCLEPTDSSAAVAVQGQLAPRLTLCPGLEDAFLPFPLFLLSVGTGREGVIMLAKVASQALRPRPKGC